jgi:hypothetical protein
MSDLSDLSGTAMSVRERYCGPVACCRRHCGRHGDFVRSTLGLALSSNSVRW